MIKVFENNFDSNIENYIQEVFCLDNFSAFSVKLGKVVYKTAEHAFQTLKFKETAPFVADQIKNALSPYDAREIAQTNKAARRKDWSAMKYDIMENILTEKAKQNPYVLKKLLATNKYKIIEDCGEDDDKDWGCGIDGTGENNLGKIWMKVREKFYE